MAFLAEYDALPGLGHACGHNLIGVLDHTHHAIGDAAESQARALGDLR